MFVNVKSTCISKMPSQRTFSETANSYLHLLGLTFRGSIPWQQLAKFFWLSKIWGSSGFHEPGQISVRVQSVLNSSLNNTENYRAAGSSLRCIGKQKVLAINHKRLNEVRPKFCVKSKMCCKIEKIFLGGSEFIRCCRIYILTPVGMDVKGGEAVHFRVCP